MTELERNLASLRLAAPSAALDRRMSDTFSAAARTAPSSHRTSLWWWLAALTAAGAATVLLLFAPGSRPPRPERLVYRIEAKGPLRRLLLDPPASASDLPHFVINEGTR